MELEVKKTTAWEAFYDNLELNQLANNYLDFLSQNKTERETISWIKNVLEKHGFEQDFSQDKVFKTLHNKTIFIAKRGKKPLTSGTRLICAHVDSPRLDLKQHPLYEECEVVLAKTHYYGGIKKYQWLARPLALHGVIIKTNGKKINFVLGENQDDPVFTISDLLPHLAHKQIEKKVKDAFEAEKLNIILGHIPLKNKDNNKKQEKRIKKHLLHLLFERFAIGEEDLYSAEIQAVPAGKARFVGLDKGLIGGYGQDDRACVFLSLNAFLKSDTPNYTQILIFWDKEEIGSDGSTGAKSFFLQYCLEELLDAWKEKGKISQVFLNMKAISADVHAPIEADYQDAHEKLNASRLGYGPVFCKFTGHKGKYGANDAHAEYIAWLRNILNRKQIPWQMAELGKVDLGGGGTVAKFLASYGGDVIDCGPGLLSMHSPFEISSTVDLYTTYLAYKAFFEEST
ncbi:MAG: aminopeptidase [Desulfonauticus sp.]|nr:aminopeptidase [Desulfonauticus sp.]